MKKQLKKFCSVANVLRLGTDKPNRMVFLRTDARSTTLQTHADNGSILELRLPAPIYQPGDWSMQIGELETWLKEPGEAVVLGELQTEYETLCILPLPGPEAISMPAETFGALRFCSLAMCGPFEIRTHLEQVQIIPALGTVISSDGHRMHVVDIPCFKHNPLHGHERNYFCIKGTDVSAIVCMLNDAKDAGTILQYDGRSRCGNENLFVFKGGLTLRLELADGSNFPDYTEVTPDLKQYDVTVKFDAKKWLKLVPKKGDLKLAVNGAVTLTTKLGTVVDLPVLSSSGEVTIGVNASYITEALTKGEITLHVRGPLDPLVLEGADRLAVIMPLRLEKSGF